MSITTCESNGIFTGVQVFFGRYKQVAGASHGDLSTTCTNTRIRGPVVEIEIYNDPADSKLIQGMVFKMQEMTDVAYPGQVISVGRVNQDNQQRYRLAMPTPTGRNRDDAENFWGFETETDVTTFEITSIKILGFVPKELFKSLTCYRSEQSLYSDGISKGKLYKNQVSDYGLQVIQNKQLGKLEMPTDLACINCEERDGSRRKIGVAVAFLIIGCIFLMMAACSLLAMCMMKKKMSAAMGGMGAGGQSATVVVQNSFISNNTTPNQAKLDDIM